MAFGVSPSPKLSVGTKKLHKMNGKRTNQLFLEAEYNSFDACIHMKMLRVTINYWVGKL